ncbi:MAG: hypothetical protein EHM72_15870 [Calditrichaeota bacterium]|nr:MAG: hypothetical protein EHM72_15870 [Calditrichota bacterium]
MAVNRIILAACLLLAPSQAAWSGINGLEFRLTFSGRLLLGIGYRHQIDNNTAIRLGSYAGISGTPVGFYGAIAQDITPQSSWTPYFQIGFDAVYFKKSTIRHRVYPSAACGFSYSPHIKIKHSSEVWLALFSSKLRLMGITYALFNTVL